MLNSVLCTVTNTLANKDTRVFVRFHFAPRTCTVNVKGVFAYIMETRLSTVHQVSFFPRARVHMYVALSIFFTEILYSITGRT